MEKREDLQCQLQCIAQIQKAFLEGFVQIVLINTIQPKILGESKRSGDGSSGPSSSTETAEEIRTIMQYLIEVVEAI